MGQHDTQDFQNQLTIQELKKEYQGFYCLGLSGTPQKRCEIEQADAVRQNQIANDDLKAQQDMAIWAFGMLIVSSITAGITLWALFYVRGTMSATLAAVEASSEATAEMTESNRLFRMDQRAWVQLEFDPTKIYFGDRQVSIEYKAKLKNIGRSVATSVCFECRSYIFGSSNEIEIPTFLQSDFKPLSQRMTRDLLPNGEVSISSTSNIPIDEVYSVAPVDGEWYFAIVVAAKIQYHASEDDPIARTGMSYHIFERRTGIFKYIQGTSRRGEAIAISNGRFSLAR